MAEGKQVYTLRSLAEARALAERATRECAQPWRARMAVLELLVNAIEHGNLEIDHAAKACLLAQSEWESEVARRLAQPRYAGREVELTRWRDEGRWRFQIRDQGAGFDWRPWLLADEAQRRAAHGRGILLARQLGLVDLEYLEPGNCVRFAVPDA